MIFFGLPAMAYPPLVFIAFGTVGVVPVFGIFLLSLGDFLAVIRR